MAGVHQGVLNCAFPFHAPDRLGELGSGPAFDLLCTHDICAYIVFMISGKRHLAGTVSCSLKTP